MHNYIHYRDLGDWYSIDHHTLFLGAVQDHIKTKSIGTHYCSFHITIMQL